MDDWRKSGDKVVEENKEILFTLGKFCASINAEDINKQKEEEEKAEELEKVERVRVEDAVNIEIINTGGNDQK